jgi:hypothetical protein
MKMKTGGYAMKKEIFISYSRRDQEFVTRLASDLNAQVAGVWFDQTTIELGQKWHDEIMDGIRDCKAFILVLSPDSMESKYVNEEVSKALELGKTIFPVIYRPAKWSGQFDTLVKEVQTLDLRSGSYTDSFHKLVDGLIAAGAGKPAGKQSFIRETTKTDMRIVLRKIPGWAVAWGLGWLAFWSIVFVLFFIIVVVQGKAGMEDLLNFAVILTSGGIGGFTGGLIAGLFTMLALRPNAPSITWKHMSPTIRIWAVNGPLGMIVSGMITALMLAIGAISVQSIEPDCSGGFGDCVGQIFGAALGQTIGIVIAALLVFLLFVTVAWFLTGLFAGWQVVRHIRRLEPGITSRQSRSVSIGWGCGAIVAAVATAIIIGVLTNILRL